MTRTVGMLLAGTAIAAVFASLGATSVDLVGRSPASAAAARPSGLGDTPRGPEATATGRTTERPEAWVLVAIEGLAAAREVRLVDGQVLATVNGVTLTPADLGVGRGGATLSPETYAVRLDRAVEHEVTRQAAEAEQIGLTEAQQRRLEARARGLDDGAAAGSPESAEYVRREFATAMLMDSLGEKHGVPGRQVTPSQVERFYADNPGAYGALPTDPAERAAAWKEVEIDIRQQLAREVALRHDAELRRLADAMRADAEIEVADPAW